MWLARRRDGAPRCTEGTAGAAAVRGGV